MELYVTRSIDSPVGGAGLYLSRSGAIRIGPAVHGSNGMIRSGSMIVRNSCFNVISMVLYITASEYRSNIIINCSSIPFWMVIENSSNISAVPLNERVSSKASFVFSNSPLPFESWNKCIPLMSPALPVPFKLSSIEFIVTEPICACSFNIMIIVLVCPWINSEGAVLIGITWRRSILGFISE